MNLKTSVSSPWRGIGLQLARISFVLIVFTGLSQFLYAQTTTYSFSFKNATLDQVIDQVAKKSGYEFVFDAEYVKQSKPITLEIKSSSIKAILDDILKTQNFSYEISGKTIVLKPKALNKQNNSFYVVKGKVIDSIGAGIPGVIIRLKGQSTGVQSNADGSFLLNVAGDRETLLFTYIGYNEREYEVTPAISGSNISIVLSPTVSLLNEVFVNGFQKISKERTTASYTRVSNEDLNRNLNVDLISALEGKVAGLISTKNKNGAAADKLLLRGISTFSATVGAEPLLVIDGLPTEYSLEEINPYDIESVTVLKDAAASSIYGARSANGVIIMTTKQGQGRGVKVTLNTDLFLTGKPNLDAMHYASASQLIDWETAKYNQELANNTSVENMFAAYGVIGNGILKYYSPLYQLYRDQAAGITGSDQVNATLGEWRQNDYIKDYTENVWQNEVRQRYNLSFSSATDKSNTFISLNYDQGKGRIINNLNRAFNLNIKSSFKIKSWLSATVGLNGKYANDEATDGTYNDLFLQERYARIVDANGNLVISPYVEVKDGFGADGAINGSVIRTISGNTALKSFGFNVVDALGDGIEKTKFLNLRAFGNVEAKLYKGLSFISQIQYETSSNDLDTYHTADGYRMRYASNMFTSFTNGVYTSNLNAGGRYYQLNRSSNNYTFRNQVNYNKGFGKNNTKHYISALAGFEMRQTFSPVFNESLHYGYDPQTLQFANLNEKLLSDDGVNSYFGGLRRLSELRYSTMETRHRYTSLYANMSYTYQGKYSMTGSVRQDNSDLFGVEYRDKTRPFWSAGLSWNVSSEDFLNNQDWLNMLKVRATYGTNGNVDQGTNKFIVANRRSDRLITNLSYLNIVSMPNPKLRWETTASLNFGIDYAMLNSRLRGSIDLYDRKSTDLLVTRQLDPTVGALSQRINSGALRNRGLELSISGDWFKTDDWTFTTNFTFATNRNQVLEQNNTSPSASVYISSPSDYFYTGSAFNTMYAYRYGGMTNGYPYFLDQDGNANVTFDADGVPTAVRSINNPDALVKVGQLDPKYSGAFSQRIRYKNFELNALLVYSGGNQLRRDVTALDTYDVTDVDISTRWTAGSELPRLRVDYPQALLNMGAPGTLSSLWRYADNQILDATYIKLRNIGLSYNMPKPISNKLGIGGLKLTGQVNNLWYWSAAGDDIDPEVYSFNSGTRNTPNPKSFILGLNVTF
jgi:TonB-linked SusC/RagA family outer membrane protein